MVRVMGIPSGVRRDFQALEQRRMRAARLLEKGYRHVGNGPSSEARYTAVAEVGEAHVVLPEFTARRAGPG